MSEGTPLFKKLLARHLKITDYHTENPTLQIMEGEVRVCGPSTKPKSEIKAMVAKCGLIETFAGWKDGREVTQFIFLKNTAWMCDWINEKDQVS
jgi:hypothetical protein